MTDVDLKTLPKNLGPFCITALRSLKSGRAKGMGEYSSKYGYQYAVWVIDKRKQFKTVGHTFRQDIAFEWFNRGD